MSLISWLGEANPDATTIFWDEFYARGLEREAQCLKRRGIAWSAGFNPSHGSRCDVSSACQIANTPSQCSSRHSDLIGSQHYNLDIIFE